MPLPHGYFAAGGVAVSSKLSWARTSTKNNTRAGNGDISFTNMALGPLPEAGQRRYIAVCSYASHAISNRSAYVSNTKLNGVSMSEIVSEKKLVSNTTEKRNGAVYIREENTLLSTTIATTIVQNESGSDSSVDIAVYSIMAPAEGLTWLGNKVVDYDSPYTQNPAYNALKGDLGMSWINLGAANTINGNSWPKDYGLGGKQVLMKDFEANESGNVTLDSADGGSVSAIIYKPGV